MHRSTQNLLRRFVLLVIAAVLAACSGEPTVPSEAVNAEYIPADSIDITASGTTDAVLETANAPVVEMFSDDDFSSDGWSVSNDLSNFQAIINPDGSTFNDKLSSFRIFRN